MSLTQPKTVFGVHNLTLYNPTDLLPYGIVKVVGNLNFALAGEQIDLMGGSNAYPWDSEVGAISAELTGTIRQLENFMFEKFLAASVTATAAAANGSVGSLTNKVGTSIFNASTGIATATAKVGSEADLKDGLYIVVYQAADAVDVYAMSDVDFRKGTAKTFENDLLKITASPLTITASTAIEIPGFGVELTGGSGVIALTSGDTAYFYVTKQNDGGSDIITFGQSGSIFAEFGCYLASQKKGDGSTFRMKLPRCKAAGLPINLTEKDWLGTDITIKALYCSSADSVGEILRTTNVTSC